MFGLGAELDELDLLLGGEVEVLGVEGLEVLGETGVGALLYQFGECELEGDAIH